METQRAQSANGGLSVNQLGGRKVDVEAIEPREGGRPGVPDSDPGEFLLEEFRVLMEAPLGELAEVVLLDDNLPSIDLASAFARD